MKHFSYKKVNKIFEKMIPCSPNVEIDNEWIKIAENEDFIYITSRRTADNRLVKKSNNQVVWSYYEDFYCC